MPKKKRKSKQDSHLKLVSPQYTLCYGMRIDRGIGPEGGHPHVPVKLPDGTTGEMALHTISGTKREIRDKLQHSVEAFFDIYLNDRSRGADA
ncbi:MAG TPA: hypothetical protein VLY20_10975 [Nitrospiria bacterium]|nr:hypothetical protein [Nitrospiria bacterium]